MEETLSQIINFFAYIYFSAALILITLVFIRVRLHLDLSMICLSLLYLLQFFLRLPFMSGFGGGVSSVDSLAHALIYFLLYFFIFEMWRYEAKL